MRSMSRQRLIDYLMKSSDWLIVLLLFVSIKVFNLLVPPFQRNFSLLDPSIAYPHKEVETINNVTLWMLSLVLPILVILLAWLKKRNHKELYYALLGLLLSSMLAYFICHFVKNIVGRLRPDFLRRCKPDLSKVPEGDSNIASLVDISICTAKTMLEKKDLIAGSQSFFSGHTSTAFSGLGFLSLYLAHIFYLWRRPGQVYKVVIALVPLMIALYIGLSRVSDYRHHWEDVLVGLIIGLLCAQFSFKQYFPIVDNNETMSGPFTLSTDNEALLIGILVGF